MSYLEVSKVVAAAEVPYNIALHVLPAGCSCPCGRSSVRPCSGPAVDMRVDAVPPSSADARSTKWTICFRSLRVYLSNVGSRVAVASLSYECRTVSVTL